MTRRAASRHRVGLATDGQLKEIREGLVIVLRSEHHAQSRVFTDIYLILEEITAESGRRMIFSAEDYGLREPAVPGLLDAGSHPGPRAV